MTDTFLGYRRADGRVGVRNVVAVLSAMDNTNPSAERIASMVNGTEVLATPFGRGQIGADFEVTRRTLAGIAGHPNVAGVLVLSLSLASGEELGDRGAGGTLEEIRFFLDCVKEDRPVSLPAANLDEAVKTMELADAILAGLRP